MTGKDEGYAHPARIDRCSLIREEADYYRGAGLKATPDTDGEYDSFVPNG